MTQIRNKKLHKLGVTEFRDAFGHTSFRSTGKTLNIAPAIMNEFFEGSVRMYNCVPHPGEAEPRIFVADTYDKRFLPSHGLKVNFKPNKREQIIYGRKY